MYTIFFRDACYVFFPSICTMYIELDIYSPFSIAYKKLKHFSIEAIQLNTHVPEWLFYSFSFIKPGQDLLMYKVNEIVQYVKKSFLLTLLQQMFQSFIFKSGVQIKLIIICNVISRYEKVYNPFCPVALSPSVLLYYKIV